MAYLIRLRSHGGYMHLCNSISYLQLFKYMLSWREK